MFNFLDIRGICGECQCDNFLGWKGEYKVSGVKYDEYVDQVVCDMSFHATNPLGHTQYVVYYEDPHGYGGCEWLCPECYADLLHELVGGEVGIVVFKTGDIVYIIWEGNVKAVKLLHGPDKDGWYCGLLEDALELVYEDDIYKASQEAQKILDGRKRETKKGCMK